MAWPALLVTALSPNKPIEGAEEPTGTHIGARTDSGGTQTIFVSLCLSFPVTQHPRRIGDGGNAVAPLFTIPFGLGTWSLGPAGWLLLFGLLMSVKSEPLSTRTSL